MYINDFEHPQADSCLNLRAHARSFTTLIHNFLLCMSRTDGQWPGERIEDREYNGSKDVFH